MTLTHQTAPTQFVEDNGIRFAYCNSAKRAMSRLPGKLTSNQTTVPLK